MTATDDLPVAAIAALRDLLDELKRDNTDCTVTHLPNGNILCTWQFGGWVVSSTITPDWQIVKYVAVSGGT